MKILEVNINEEGFLPSLLSPLKNEPKVKAFGESIVIVIPYNAKNPQKNIAVKFSIYFLLKFNYNFLLIDKRLKFYRYPIY